MLQENQIPAAQAGTYSTPSPHQAFLLLPNLLRESERESTLLCVQWETPVISRFLLPSHFGPLLWVTNKEKQEQTLFKDLRRQDIEIKKDETKKEWDISNGFLIKGS